MQVIKRSYIYNLTPIYDEFNKQFNYKLKYNIGELKVVHFIIKII